MQKFLEQYVYYHLNNSQKTISQHLIVLPSKRSVSALKNTFAKHTQSLWLPQVIDIVPFIEEISKLNILHNSNDVILEFYKVYKNCHQKDGIDPFENFYSWAKVLIADFNELDRFLIDPETFFEHHKALKKVDYFGKEKTEIVKSYIQFWEDMPVYYNHFKSHLLENNTAYQGLAYREAAKNIVQFLERNPKQITFLGFNALNTAEEVIIENCLKTGQTKIGWDIDQYYLEEKQHPSNVFIKTYQKKWINHKKAFIDLSINNYKSKKNIQLLSSPKSVGQAKCVAEVLCKMTKTEIENTAIVLNDENLLHPILNSIPVKIEEVNITMGLPLLQSPITDFFLSLVNYQKSGQETLDYNFLKSLFDHNLLSHEDFAEYEKLVDHLNADKIKKTSLNQLLNLLDRESKLRLILDCLKPAQHPLAFTKSIIDVINMFLELENHAFKQYLFAFKNVFIEIEKTFETYSYLSFKAYSLIFKEKLESEKLSFKGSKLKGLQIMGMLETRLLDFDNVILTSVNEGILPSGKTDNSYITYNLKKEYGLPTHTEKDAIYAYHFFRLIQRAKKCYLIYDDDQSGFNKGEQSRFITYLKVFKTPNHHLEEQQFSLSTQLKVKKLMEIDKTPEIILEINKLAKHGFSPTALTTYILNPILFYKRYILKIKEAEQLEEVISHKDFGTLIHDTAETLYKKIGVLDDKKLSLFKKESDVLLKDTFERIYAKDDHKSGANRIQLEIAKAYLIKFFDKEIQTLKKAKIEILNIEESLSTSLTTSKNKVVLKGKIDRVDKCDENLRIIDLKTGKVEGKNLKFTNFDDIISDYDYSKAFQVLFYALLYSKNHNISTLNAGIISFKNLNEWFMPLIWNNNQEIDKEVIDTFEIYLGKLIDEILDPNIPFKEKEVNF